MKPLWRVVLMVLCCIAATPRLSPISQPIISKPTVSRALASQLMVKPLVMVPSNTNTLGIHAVWDIVLGVDSYDLGWGTNVGVYSWMTNVVNTDAVIRWPTVKPVPILVVRSRQGNVTSDWSEPFMRTNYVTIWTEKSTNLTSWVEIPGTRLTLEPINAIEFFNEKIQKTDNYPTLP